ncbi:MAG TPA: DMT family transporter [Burkholderiales bacterium]
MSVPVSASATVSAAAPPAAAIPSAPLPRWLAIVLMMAITCCFASNHVSARFAFEHGANVVTAVTFRSAGTALIVFCLLRLLRVPFRIAPELRGKALLIGLVLSVQSFCLYSAVARIPVALALLAFNTCPLMLTLISWAARVETPPKRALWAMPAALCGLALALDVSGATSEGHIDLARRWVEIGAGVAFALVAALSFAVVLFLSTLWLKSVDGRVRSSLTMMVVAVVTISAGAATTGFALPRDPAGWTGLILLTLFYGTAITSLFVILPRLGAASNSALLNFEPIAALILGFFVLDQAVAPLQIAGALIVVCAIVSLGLAKR